MRAIQILATAALAMAAGCALLSDFHTGGFSMADAGHGCTGTSDCDAGQVCCVASLAAETACQAAPCPIVAPLPSPVQLCHGDSDCGDAGCVNQTCTGAGESFTVQSCGAVTGCTMQPRTAGDATAD